MITPLSIQKVIDTAQIEEVIGEFVHLKRTGANYKGLSPFTNEKTPSFVVSPSKQIFKCFSSGKGGSAVTFLMEHEQMNYPEAIRWLAKKYNIELEETEQTDEHKEEIKHREALLIVSAYARDHFSSELWTGDDGKVIGLPYFKERGLLESTIKAFDLGFAGTNRHAFSNKAIQDGYEKVLLEELGLVGKSGTDFFYNRVMFTIHDPSGRPIAFAGRIMGKETNAPKYVNSPESEIYKKSSVLYGMAQARQAIRKQDECILVEGYMDVLTLYQAGIENVVASSGTALTEDQIRLIKRHSNNVLVLYDGDDAGIKAAIRGTDLMLEQDMNVKICLLPEGKDPDNFVKEKGHQAFLDFKEAHSQDFIAFKSEYLIGSAPNDPIKKTELIKELLQTIAKIPDPIKRSVYLSSCAARFDLNESILVSELNKLIKSRLFQQQKRNIRDKASRDQLQADSTLGLETDKESSLDFESDKKSIHTHEYQEKDLIRILITYGDSLVENPDQKQSLAEYIVANISDILDQFENSVHRKILEHTLQQISLGISPGATYFSNHDDKEIQDLALETLMPPYEYSENWEDRYGMFLETQPKPDKNYSKDATEAILRFKLKMIQKQCKLNQDKIDLAFKDAQEDEVVKLMKVHKKLMEIRNQISDQLGTVVF